MSEWEWNAGWLKGVKIEDGSPADGQVLLYDEGGNVLVWASPPGGDGALPVVDDWRVHDTDGQLVSEGDQALFSDSNDLELTLVPPEDMKGKQFFWCPRYGGRIVLTGTPSLSDCIFYNGTFHEELEFEDVDFHHALMLIVSGQIGNLDHDWVWHVCPLSTQHISQ